MGSEPERAAFFTIKASDFSFFKMLCKENPAPINAQKTMLKLGRLIKPFEIESFMIKPIVRAN